MRTICSLFVLVMIVAAVGCGKNVGVTGTVTFEDGSPLTVGTVIFDSGREQAKGTIASDGTYTLGSFSNSDGVPPGSYKVYVTGAMEGGKLGTMGQTMQLPKELIDRRFTKAETSDLTCDVKGNTRFDIKVTPPEKN